MESELVVMRLCWETASSCWTGSCRGQVESVDAVPCLLQLSRTSTAQPVQAEKGRRIDFALQGQMNYSEGGDSMTVSDGMTGGGKTGKLSG